MGQTVLTPDEYLSNLDALKRVMEEAFAKNPDLRRLDFEEMRAQLKLKKNGIRVTRVLEARRRGEAKRGLWEYRLVLPQGSGS